MTGTASFELNRCFAVRWSELTHWDIPSASESSSTLPSGWVWARVGDVAKQVTSRVKADADTAYKMAGVRWWGEGMFHRETVLGREMSASQVTPAVPGAVIYNRLFAWKVAFAVVPDDLADCFVSTEFPQFLVDDTRVLPEYLSLYFTLDSTIRAVTAASTGSAAVSRNRFKEGRFLDFKIALPPKSEQLEILRKWEKARRAVLAESDKAEAARTSILDAFLKPLNLPLPKAVTPPRAFAAQWKDVDRWGAGSVFHSRTAIDLSCGKYPPVDLGSIAVAIQYGTSAKANTSGTGTPVIRMNNLVDGELDLSDLKYLNLKASELTALRLNDGDILFNRTNSKELVGKCAAFHEDGEYVFASYLIRVVLDRNVADPDYVVFFLNSKLGRQQINAVSRPIIGQANINSEELRGLRVPLPPVSMQTQLMKRVHLIRQEMLDARRKAEARLASVRRELEDVMFGRAYEGD